MASKTKNVLIMVSRSDSFGNDLIIGIIEYSKLCGNWSLTTELPPYLEALEKAKHKYSFKNSGFDGVIASIPNKEKANKLYFGDVPAVIAHETDEKKLHNIPSIVCDNTEIGRLAANFFHERGFRNMAFFGFREFNWSVERQTKFIDANKQLNLETDIFLLPKKAFKQKSENEARVISWLKNLKTPAAILCANDDLGLYLIKRCKEVEIKVPNQIAILGIDNNEIDCNLTSPSLSSISYNSQKAGFQAAEILDQMMDGKAPQNYKILISPLNIINRMSTDFFAVPDTDILNAINFIKSNSRNLISVDDVARAVNISRRNLSRKFRDTLGRSISNEIKRAKTELICHMLTETDISVSTIAYKMGFNDATHISRFFKSQIKVSPIEYRNNYSINKGSS